jgi:hypothetical protein
MRCFEARVRTPNGIVNNYWVWASCALEAKNVIETKYGPQSLLSFPLESQCHHARTSIWENTQDFDRGLYRDKK